jgi:hypothetical protein
MAVAIPNYPVKVKMLVEVNIMTYGGNTVDSIEVMKNNLTSTIQNAIDGSNCAGQLIGQTVVDSVKVTKL